MNPLPNERLDAIVGELSPTVPTLSSALSPARGTLSNETASEPTTGPPPATDPSVPLEETLYDDDPPGEDTLDPLVPSEETLYDDDPPGEETLVDPSGDPILQYIMSLQNYRVPHKCYVAITTNPSDVTNEHYPVVWCDFRVPAGLNVTAEIKDGGCDEFQDPSASDVYMRGVASAIFLPEITEEEKLGGTIDHEYCARVDYLYDADGTGNHDRSVLDQRFPMAITYLYQEEIDEETGQIVEEVVDVRLMDENTIEDEQDLDLILGLSFLAGAIFTVALTAILMGGKGKKKKKEKQRLQQMMEDGGVDVEITPIVAPPREENEIL